MKPPSKEKTAEEIVLIRKRGTEEEGHHGGIWKIAYADFMTALMAFFLVMWLVNAADKKTVQQIAAYFNPIQLTDKLPTPKGIHEEDKTVPQNVGDTRDLKAPVPAVKQERAGTSDAPTVPSSLEAAPPQERVSNPSASQGSVSNTRSPSLDEPGEGPERMSGPDGKLQAADMTLIPSTVPVSRPPLPAAAQSSPSILTAARDISKNASALKLLASDISMALKDIPEQARPHIEIRAVNEGILISLTDDLNFSMFEIASAIPAPELTRVMDRLTTVIAPLPGRIVLRGHTDGRAYRTGGYGNWRLSSARAEAAHELLAKGIDESRFLRIEGCADRSLKVAADPQAAQNRRIEILLTSGIE